MPKPWEQFQGGTATEEPPQPQEQPKKPWESFSAPPTPQPTPAPVAPVEPPKPWESFAKETHAAANKPDFDPAAHAAQNPDDFEDAFRIYQARKARPFTEKASEFGKTLAKGDTWKEAGKGVLNFMAGFPQVAYNTAQQLKSAHPIVAAGLTAGSSNLIPDRDALASQAEATLTGQHGEQSLTNATNAIINLRPEYAAGASGEDVGYIAPETPEEQAKREENRQRAIFTQKVQAAKNALQLAQGRPLDTGAIAGIYALGGQVPSEEVGPEALKAAGAEPVSQGRIGRMSAASDPVNIALAAAPGVPGARLVGGGATELAGKALQLPFKAAEAAHGRLGQFARGSAGAAAVLETAMHPVAGAKVAAGVAGAKGLQFLGKALEAQGKELRTGLPSELTTASATAATKGEGNLGKEVLRRGGNAVANAATTAAGIAPLNLALSEGDPAEFAKLEAGAAAFGATLGGLNRNRAALVEGARPVLRSEGARALAEASEGNDTLAQKSAAYIMALPEQARDSTLEVIGALQGLPVETPSGTKRGKVYVLSEPDYLAENSRVDQEFAKTTGQPAQAAMEGGRGFFYGPDGAAYVNGDYHSGLAPEELTHTIGHEFGGHTALNMLRALGARGGVLFDGLIDAAKRNLFTRGGKPTPGFQQFIAEYNRRFDPSGQTQRLDANNPDAIEEFIAETAGQIMAGRGAAELALPRNIEDRINDGIGQFLGGLVGLDTRNVGTDTHFNREEIGELTKAVQDTLGQLAGMKLREGAEIPEAPKTDTTRIAELQTILRTPRPAPGSPLESVRQWQTDQRAAQKELNELQQGTAQGQFPAAGAPPTPPSIPQAPIAPTVNKARVAAILRQQGLNPAEAKAWAEQAQGATDAEAVLDALKKRGAQKFPTEAPILPRAANVNEPKVNEPTGTPTPPPSEPLQESGKVGVAQPPVAPVAPPGVKPGAAPLPARQAVDALVAAAEAKAVAAEKRGLTTQAAKDRVHQAKVNAILDAIGDDPNGIHRVVEEDGTVSRVGDFDPENPYHQALAELGGGVQGPALESLLSLQGSKDHTRFIRYNSALSSAGGEGGEGTLGTGMDTRQAEYELNPAQNRKEADIQHKAVVPLQTIITKDGVPQVRVFTLDNLLHNAESVREFMRSNPEFGPFPYDNEQTLIADAEAYANNHAHGWKGDGSAPMKGFPDSNLPKPDLNYRAEQIPKERFDVLNMLLKSEDAGKTPKRELRVEELRQKVAAAKNEREKARLQGVLEREVTRLGRSREAVNLARVNNPWVDDVSGETNQLRAKLKAAGLDTDVALKPPIETLDPKHILAVSDQPLELQPGDIPSVRPTGFQTPPQNVAPLQRLNPTAVRANFMPLSEADTIRRDAMDRWRKEFGDEPIENAPAWWIDRHGNLIPVAYEHGEISPDKLHQAGFDSGMARVSTDMRMGGDGKDIYVDNQRRPMTHGQRNAVRKLAEHTGGEVITEGDSRNLFYMPADYAIEHRPNSEGPRGHDLLENELAPRDIYQHPEWYTGQPGTLAFRQTVQALNKMKGNPEAEVTVYRASPKNELNAEDWVSLSKVYAKQHGMADNPSDDVPVHSHKVKAKDIRWAGDELSEFGYFPETQKQSPREAAQERIKAMPIEQDLDAAEKLNAIGERKVRPQDLGLPYEDWQGLSGPTEDVKTTIPVSSLKIGRDELNKAQLLAANRIFQREPYRQGDVSEVHVIPSREPGKYVVASNGNHRAAILLLTKPEAKIQVTLTRPKE